MTINAQEAQLIFDAIYWLNSHLDIPEGMLLYQSREDFVAFCKARGIEDVEVVRKA